VNTRRLSVAILPRVTRDLTHVAHLRLCGYWRRSRRSIPSSRCTRYVAHVGQSTLFGEEVKSAGVGFGGRLGGTHVSRLGQQWRPLQWGKEDQPPGLDWLAGWFERGHLGLLLAVPGGTPEEPAVRGVAGDGPGSGAERGKELVAVFDRPSGRAVLGLNDDSSVGLASVSGWLSKV